MKGVEELIPIVEWLRTAFYVMSGVIGLLWSLHMLSYKADKKKLENLQAEYTKLYGDVEKLKGFDKGHERAVRKTAEAVVIRMEDRIELAVGKAIKD